MTELATIAGSCFWCIEAGFPPLKGVERVVSGYIGGGTGEPTYEEVCSGRSRNSSLLASVLAVAAWGVLRTTELAALNARLRAGGAAEIR